MRAAGGRIHRDRRRGFGRAIRSTREGLSVPAAHRSTEPGHAPLLEIIGQRPLLDLEMRLGEGTGAALAIPVVRAAVEAFTGMATFESAAVSERESPAS